MYSAWIFIVCCLVYSTLAETDFKGYNTMPPSYRNAPYAPAAKPYPPSKPYPPANAPYPASGTGGGTTGVGASVSGPGVTGFGTGPGIGPGLTAAGFGPGFGPAPGPGVGPGLGPGLGPGPGFVFPPFFGPFGPVNPALYGLTPFCAKIEVLRSYVTKLINPVFVGVLSFLVFFVLKSLFLPYLGTLAKVLEARSSVVSESNLDLVASTVYKAISSRVCMERIVCKLGNRTKDYSFTKSIVR